MGTSKALTPQMASFQAEQVPAERMAQLALTEWRHPAGKGGDQRYHHDTLCAKCITRRTMGGGAGAGAGVVVRLRDTEVTLAVSRLETWVA